MVKIHKSPNERVKIISRGSFAVRIEWCHFQASLSAAFFDFLKYMCHHTRPPRHTLYLAAMQHGGRPMALKWTEIESQKSEHDSARQISIVERDLRPI